MNGAVIRSELRFLLVCSAAAQYIIAAVTQLAVLRQRHWDAAHLAMYWSFIGMVAWLAPAAGWVADYAASYHFRHVLVARSLGVIGMCSLFLAYLLFSENTTSEINHRFAAVVCVSLPLSVAQLVVAACLNGALATTTCSQQRRLAPREERRDVVVHDDDDGSDTRVGVLVARQTSAMFHRTLGSVGGAILITVVSWSLATYTGAANEQQPAGSNTARTVECLMLCGIAAPLSLVSSWFAASRWETERDEDDDDCVEHRAEQVQEHRPSGDGDAQADGVGRKWTCVSSRVVRGLLFVVVYQAMPSVKFAYVTLLMRTFAFPDWLMLLQGVVGMLSALGATYLFQGFSQSGWMKQQEKKHSSAGARHDDDDLLLQKQKWFLVGSLCGALGTASHIVLTEPTTVAFLRSCCGGSHDASSRGIAMYALLDEVLLAFFDRVAFLPIMPLAAVLAPNGWAARTLESFATAAMIGGSISGWISAGWMWRIPSAAAGDMSTPAVQNEAMLTAWFRGLLPVASILKLAPLLLLPLLR